MKPNVFMRNVEKDKEVLRMEERKQERGQGPILQVEGKEEVRLRRRTQSRDDSSVKGMSFGVLGSMTTPPVYKRDGTWFERIRSNIPCVNIKFSRPTTTGPESVRVKL